MRGDDLKRAGRWLGEIVAEQQIGTRDRPRTVTRLELALDNAEVRAQDKLPREGEVGGSSTPAELGDKREERALGKQAAADLVTLRTLPAEIEARIVGTGLLGLIDELHLAVRRQTMVNRPDDKRPANPVPGCKSCARSEKIKGIVYGPHFKAVDERRKLKELCRWCGDFAASHRGEWPPIQAVELYHTQTPSAAGRWLTRNGFNQPETWTPSTIDIVTLGGDVVREVELPDDPRPCASVFTHLGKDLRCIRAADHEGEHRGVDEGKSVPWENAVERMSA